MDGRVGVGALWARATVAAGLVFLLGVAGHVTADGLLPGALALGVLFVAVLGLCLSLLSRRVGLPSLLGLMVGGQSAVHAALSLGAGHAGDATTRVHTSLPVVGATSLPTADGRRVGSLVDAYQATSPSAGRAGDGLSTSPIAHLVNDLGAHPLIAALHLAAAALVALWLAHGERLLWSVLALMARRVQWPHLIVLPPAAPVARRLVSRLLPASDVFVLQSCSRRGPPVLV